MPGTDGFVGIVDAGTPTEYVDNQQVGTHLGQPVQRQRVSAFEATGLVPLVYDALALTYNPDGTTATVQYYVGGTGGTLVGTLTLGYTSGNLTSVART